MKGFIKNIRLELVAGLVTIIGLVCGVLYLRHVMMGNRAVGYQLRADQMTTAQLLERAVATNSALRRAEFEELRRDMGLNPSTLPAAKVGR